MIQELDHDKWGEATVFLGHGIIRQQLDFLKKMDFTKPTICFYTNSFFEFSGKTIYEKAMGGSETAFANMAREMVSEGWNVLAFCKTPENGIFEGVFYCSSSRFDYMIGEIEKIAGKKLDVFVSCRDCGIFNTYLPFKLKCLWVHDYPNDYKGFKDSIDKWDYILFVSHYQRDEFLKVYRIPLDKMIATRNGVREEWYSTLVPKIKGKCIYCTTPFRGLELLLEMWIEIKKRVPYATLSVFSGMSVYGLQNDLKIKEMLEYWKQRAKELDITFFEPVKQEVLASELLTSELMLYPSIYKETSCIVALESIKAGTPIVCSAYGALPETVAGCGVLIQCNLFTDPFGKKFQEDFINATVTLLGNPESREKYKFPLADLGWNTISQEWSSFFKACVERIK